MPRNKRGDIKLKHDQIMGHLETAMEYLALLHDMFSEPHPDYAKGYENIIMILAQAHEFVQQMKGFI